MFYVQRIFEFIMKTPLIEHGPAKHPWDEAAGSRRPADTPFV